MDGWTRAAMGLVSLSWPSCCVQWSVKGVYVWDTRNSFVSSYYANQHLPTRQSSNSTVIICNLHVACILYYDALRMFKLDVRYDVRNFSMSVASFCWTLKRCAVMPQRTIESPKAFFTTQNYYCCWGKHLVQQ